MITRDVTTLVADADAASRQELGAALASAGYAVLECADADEALRLTLAGQLDVALVGVALPPDGGIALVERLRVYSSIAVMMLGTERDDPTIVRALDLGADDYVVLPCSMEQVLARVRALLRRLRPAPPAAQRPVLVAGELTVDFDQRRLYRRGREVRLRPTEWQLLVELAGNAGRLLLHEELLTRAWGPEYRHDRQYLRVGIRRLRCKLEDDSSEPRYIRTVPGMGYLFDPAS